MLTHELFDLSDSWRETALELLAELVAIPSLSTVGEALEPCAEMVAGIIADSGLRVETWHGDHAPIVFGERPAAPGAPTLLFYGHYDVQPADPLDLWTTPPFEPIIRDDALYGRGSADNKGQFLTHLIAIRGLIEARRLGVGVKILIEGEEEIGSPNLARVVDTHRDALRCDLALTADGPFHDDGKPVIIFGVRGLLYLEVRLRGADHDVHSGNRGGIVPTPAWDLVHALASLRDITGEVLVPNFERDVRPPTRSERDLLHALPFDRAGILKGLGLNRFPAPADEVPWEALMFRPTLNICGLSSGYGGPGAKTIVPSRALAKIDIRLVADQDPDRMEEAIRAHLTQTDLDLEVVRLAAVPPSSTPLDLPFVQPIASAIASATGFDPWLRPRLGGTTPDHVFTRVLGVPSLLVPYASPDMNNHAPDEKMTLAALERGIRSTASICCVLSEHYATA